MNLYQNRNRSTDMGEKKKTKQLSLPQGEKLAGDKLGVWN